MNKSYWKMTTKEIILLLLKDNPMTKEQLYAGVMMIERVLNDKVY